MELSGESGLEDVDMKLVEEIPADGVRYWGLYGRGEGGSKMKYGNKISIILQSRVVQIGGLRRIQLVYE